MDYKQKLIEWNNSDKYWSELMFLETLIYAKECDYVLDYGCGIGTAIHNLNRNGYWVYGYDVNEYMNDTYWYDNDLTKEYTAIYFMHSFAHIPNPKEVLTNLRSRYPEAQVTVITPNAYWLMLQSNKDYKPDPTVIQHYTQTQLKELFESVGYKVTLIGQFGEEKTGVNERIFLQAS
jgi:hypothetical protein